MILSNEPGYYITGAYGIRIENLVAVVESPRPGDGSRRMLEFETLTLAPIDRRLVDKDLLTPDEVAWFDAYHGRVLSAHRGRLDAKTEGLARRGDGAALAEKLRCHVLRAKAEANEA